MPRPKKPARDISKDPARNVAKKRPRHKRDADEARTDRAMRRFGRSKDEGGR
jgi:hypothetical protein